MIVGCDPGLSGGLVFLTEDWPAAFSAATVHTLKMPVVTEKRKKKKNKNESDHVFEQPTREAIYEAMKAMACGDQVTLFIEEIPKWAGAARFAQQTVRASALAVLYGNMSVVMGIALGLGWRVMPLRPQAWQSAVGCENEERLEKTAWKNKLKGHAASMFPQVKVVGWNADALLIAAAGMALGLQVP